ncbi:MAG: ABC transporter permease [Methanobacteriota archaeon]|nr:MAG: ABC transporter permease [Euryarchaeota archaeon]
MVEPVKTPPVNRDRESGIWRNYLHLIPMVVVAVAFVGLWELVFRLQIRPPYLLPSPSTVARALYDLWISGALPRAIAATLVRLGVGFLISLVLGAILAFLSVHFTTFGKGIQPYILGLQTFPSIAWVPLTLIWFGFSETGLLFVTIVGSLFAVTASFADALRTVPPVYLKAARNMGSDGMDLILRVTVPAALPHLLTAAKVGWSFAWRSLIGAEIIFATVGLGFVLNEGAAYLLLSQVIGVMIVILVIGVVVDRGFFSRTEEWTRRRRGLIPSR